LRAEVEAAPNNNVSIDVVALRVRSAGGLDFAVTMPESARDALIAGRWDPIQELLENVPAIDAKAAELHYV